MRASRRAALSAALEAAAESFDADARLDHDPLGIVRGYGPGEREVVAHIVAPLAYGAVQSIRSAAREVLGAMGRSPTDALSGYARGDFLRWRPGFVYRMTTAADVDAYLAGLAELYRGGGLRAAFSAADPGDGDVRVALIAYVARIRDAMRSDRRGARYLTPDPATGSATKRWHLMLRWLVRPDDGADLGLWTDVGPERLVLPLDTHVARLVRYLGMTARRTADYRAARDATDVLLGLDPADPLRFDMPLCHLGIAGACRHRFDEVVCGTCDLFGVCVHTRRSKGRSRA